MVKFLSSLNVLALLTLVWCALECTEATHTVRDKNVVAPGPPGSVLYEDSTGEASEQLESGGAELTNDSISPISVQSASYRPGDSEQEVDVQTEPGKVSSSKRNETVLVTEKKNETSSDGRDTKVTEKMVKLEPGAETQKEVVIEQKGETSTEPKKEKVTKKEVEIKGKGQTEKEVIIEKKGETNQEPSVEKITEREVKKEPGKETKKETVIEEKNGTNLKSKKEQVTEIKEMPGEKIMEEVFVESKAEGGATKSKKEVVKKTVVQKHENGTEKDPSEKSTVETVITEQKPNEDKNGTFANVISEKKSETTINKSNEFPGKNVSTVERTETKVVSEKPPTNETEVPVKKGIEVPKEPAKDVRFEKKSETTIKESSELPGKNVSTVEKTETKVVSEKAPTTETEVPVENIIVPREPAEEVEAEKKAETTIDKEVKKEVPKLAKKIRPVEKVPPIPSLMPLLTEHITDGTDESGYEYKSGLPSRRCLRSHRRGSRCVCERIVACRTLEGIHCAR